MSGHGESLVTSLGEAYRSRASQGDEYVRLSETGTIQWETDSGACQLLCPSDETDGIGILQIHDYDRLSGTHSFARYGFNAHALLYKAEHRMSRAEYDAITLEALNHLLYGIVELGLDRLEPP